MQQLKTRSGTEHPLDYSSICQNIRAAFDTGRIHAISLHDETGEVLWMTESSMGPDEHNAIRDAIESFARPGGQPVTASDLGDFRSAVSFQATNAREATVGAIMVVMDSRSISNDRAGLAKLITPKLNSVLRDFAGMRPAAAPEPKADVHAAAGSPSAQEGGPSELTLADTMRMRKPELPAASTAPEAPPAPATPLELTLADSMRIRKPALPPDAPSQPADGQSAASGRLPVIGAPHAAAPKPAGRASKAQASAPRHVGASRAESRAARAQDPLHATLLRSPIALSVQRLMPLTKGTELNRYEVLLRSSPNQPPNAAPAAMLKAAVDSGLGSMIDRRVLNELTSWLVRHPNAWKGRASMFSVNLTSTALRDEHFFRYAGLCLAKSSVPAPVIAFEIDVSSAVTLGAKVVDVAAALQRLGCPLILDDFGMRTECFDLLRLPGVRYVKLAPDITGKMRSDKMSQAAITAVVQMARVLGMHTVAKHTETAAEHEWLTALGVDFVQSNALSPAKPIDSLLKPAPRA